MSSLSNVSTRVTRQSARTQQAERAIDTTPLHPTKGIDALSKFTDFEDRLNQATNQYQNEAVLTEKVLKALHQLNFDELFIQCGSGIIPEGYNKIVDGEEQWTKQWEGMKIAIFRYKKNIIAEMERADLIIGHAGAGTCLEALERGKPFVTVINDALADNHQIELAERLAQDGHLLFTTPTKLADILADPRLFKLKPFVKADPSVFAQFLDTELGVT
ncbi:UDP-N-acetylglucosamine transferase subunit ALG13 like protein [Ditylenchus destructor]|uniref:UDP-N-acetylglucosamine transferase subunit ALG13 n=1 Tax=Ditylenchus destructor TaxID=166010 RepID=A0AAD4R2T4_9BILA|nr:UDP-N-acetylglucosamine transferase subunit ALG13 like protein [Ditylenchus destructor]